MNNQTPSVPTEEVVDMSPFKRMVMTIGTLPTAFTESMTYYEALAYFVKYLEEVTLTVNENAEATRELQTLFTELKNYVDTYFDNLDVQEEVNNKLDAMAEDGTLDEIINQEIFGELNNKVNDNASAIQEIISSQIYVIPDDLKEETDVDDTESFERAIADGRPIYLKNDSYTISSPLTINEQTIIIGKSRTTTTINYTNTNDYAFKYTPDAQYDSNIMFANFKFVGKYFVQINRNDLTDESFLAQHNIKHIIFTNLNLIGDHSFVDDPKINTNELPTLNELMGYGNAINLSKCFDCVIEKCNIQFFGLAIYFRGSDINQILSNRLAENSCHFWTDRISTYGSQNTIENNDILMNRRFGGIRINGTNFDRIINNYFEQYLPCGCFIYADNEQGLIISKNRVDQPSTSFPVFIVNPSVVSDIITENTLHPASATATIEVRYSHFNPTNTTFANYNTAIVKNNPCFVLAKKPFMMTEDFNPDVISPTNLDRKIHAVTDTWNSPYVYQDNDDDGNYYFNGNLLFSFKDIINRGASSPKIEVIYRYNNNTESTLQLVSQSGSVLKSVNVTPVNDAFYHKVIIEDDATTALGRVYNVSRLRNTGDSLKIYSVRLVH